MAILGIQRDVGPELFIFGSINCGNWLQLKILEITPELTRLGATLTEALELQRAHDEVLRQLQNKQSPVEELLRQADQLIATQKPRAEVYAAMAETLGRAWKDINFNLELRKHILDLNVQYHTKAGEFFDNVKALEESCTDTVIPIEIQAVKDFLTNIHNIRRSLLESLMSALQAGNSLLAKLKELGAEGTLDSRPDQIRQSVDRALSQVQSWLDELHVRRQDVEATFNRRKLQLEQCLALAILAADLRELEEIVITCRNRLANADQLGDSTSSAELLQHENTKLLHEAQLLQERALKITKATEQLLESGCFAGEEATKQSYAILSLTSDYLTEVQNRNALLERVIAFFKSAQTAFNNLDQLEIQLTTSNLKPTSPQLAQLHAQCSKAIEEITNGPIAEGHTILNAARGGSTGTEGVRRTVEDLENIKIRLDTLCVAHREENMRINRELENFFEKHSSLLIWLTSIAEAFLQGHRDMGDNLLKAQDFMNLHNKLLTDLQDKGNEINALLLTLPPILEFLDDDRRRDVDSKVEELHEKWMKLKSLLENRLDLGRIYVKFHSEAEIVNNEIDKLEDDLRLKGQDIDDETLKNLEIKWESLEPLYQSAKNTGLTFINDAKKVSEPHLDTNRACVCVEDVLRKLAGRQLQVTRNWQTFHTDVVEKKELLIKLEETMVESTRTINWVTKLQAQLYPVITINSSSPREISTFIENKLETILPDIKRAQNEVEQKIKTAETLIAKTQTTDEKALNVKNKLCELNQKLIEITTDYQILLQVLVSYFNSLNEIDNRAENYNRQVQDDVARITDVGKIKSLISEHKASEHAVLEMFSSAQNDCDQIVQRILKQEPLGAAEYDIQKLRHILELKQTTWRNEFHKIHDALDNQLFRQFDDDLNNINRSISNLEHQNQELKNRYGKSLEEAKAASLAYSNFEKTIQDLDKRIEDFVELGKKITSCQSPLIEKHLQELQQRWNNFLKQIQETHRLIHLSIQYFQLVNEADEWFKEGSRLLVSIARRSTLVNRPQDAEELLNEIAAFLKPGEEKQNGRIELITDLAKQIYGPNLQNQLSQVVDDSRNMIKSFSSIREELDILIKNLIRAEEEKIRLEKEQREEAAKLEAAKLEAARLEALAAEKARAEALAAEKARAEALAAEKARAEALAAEKARAEALAAEKARAEALAAEKARAEALAAEKARAEALAAEKARAEALAAEKARAEALAAEKARAEALAAETARAEALAAEKARVAAELERKVSEEAARKAEIEALEQQKLAAAIAENERKAADEAARLLREVTEIQNREILSKTHIIQIKQEVSPVKAVSTHEMPSLEKLQILETPVFITPLADAVIQEGSKFSFICQVTGIPTPIVTWYKAGIPIQNNPDYQTTFDNGICKLTIEETFSDDSAMYTCRAINAAGSADTSASLSVKETEPEEQLIPPSFSKLLEPGCIKEGSPFQFQCKVEGNPLPDVQWYKNQECIDYVPGYHITYNNGEAILKFDSVDLKDKAEYTCKATNQVGIAQSTASLSITPAIPTQAPSIISPLSNVMARAGQKIKLECEVTGLPTPELVWYQNGYPLKETREQKLQREGDRATLVIFEAFPKDAGTYKVTATNLAGEASSTCSVSVKGRLPTETSDSEIASDMEPVKPSIQLPLVDLTINEGSRVRLDCVIIGQPEPEVIWYHDNRPVKESTDFQLLFQGDRCSLVIQEAYSEDGGEYKVVALNSAGEASSKCILSVKPTTSSRDSVDKEEKMVPVDYPPKFNRLLTDVLVSEGEQVIFEGNVSGHPKPQIKWLLNNQPVILDDHTEVTHNEDGDIRLTINQVRPQDKGVYTVKASNEHGEAKCFAQLIVKSSKIPDTIKYEEIKSAPVFTEIFNDKTAFANTPTKFECIVQGKPNPKVKWLFRGDPISGNNNFLVSTSGDRQVLSIPNISKDTEGTITCVAENEVGTASCSANLAVHSLSTITLPEPSEISQHIDSSFSVKREIHTESSTMMSSKIMSSTIGAPEPQTKIHSFSSHDEKTFKQVNQQTPEISESHNVEEFLQLGSKEPIIHEISSSKFSTEKPQTQVQTVQHSLLQKPITKTRAPRFMTPVIGKIVDQNTVVVLEGIIDGLPSPQVTWSKNGKEVISSDRISTKWEFNKASLEIKDTNTSDAGRYTCTAINEAGTALSTADLVVRKTIFPPVFGRRLQAQVIKKGDRLIMEVEVTGTPEPSVTWFKDSVPVEQALTDNYKMKTMGNSHCLIIEKADLKHSGRFMVRAVNSGGEAQSIADIAVFEPTPDTMVEVVKTVVFEDVRKHETLELTATPIITNVSTEKQDETYERHSRIEQQSYHQQTNLKTIKCPPPPSPSKFVKGEFRESDYESDYEKPIHKIWKPHGSDATPNYRPIRPLLTPTGKQVQVGRTPTPPTEFEEPPKTGSLLRPKFEPIDKPRTQILQGETKPETKTVVFKPKPISASQTTDITTYIPIRPGSPPEIAYAAGPQATQIYRSTTSMPYHNAIQTETSNIVHFKESNEKCHRTVSLEQNTKLIKFGDKQTNYHISETPRPKIKGPPPTTPKKFIPGEFRESDYESDVENVRIKPKWAPSGSDTEDLHYRPVRPPSSASRASSVPPSKENAASPMEFDKYPYKSIDVTDSEINKFESSSYNRSTSTSNKNIFSTRSRSYEPPVRRIEIQPGSPPEYGYVADPKFKSRATTIASHHMDNMTQAFKSKTQKFVRDIMNDVDQKSSPKKSILKNGEDKDAQIYREETRAAQYGTKHIDPDTGLIYFKYDFGYEFGILLPGESKNGGIPVPPKTTLEPPKRTVDIEMPVYHETTNQQGHQHSNLKPKVHKTTNRNIKWEPTSESELSEYEGNAKRNSQGSRWKPSSCSPVSLSPSLPSTSPAFNSSFAGSDKRRLTDTPPSCPGTPVNAQKGPLGQIRAPMFITPLRNIAVVSRQNAKFECIVQSEPPPSVLWSKNGRIIEDSDDYQLHYRNGVCRLTISRAYPEDAGTYTCTATNSAGSASTTAILDVPGEIKSSFIK
ncbi:hypothetical protein HHI36_019955 [Cryptolaemus montrouzieri]|uniref:Ig-like domain-containing protein n=1 Tax=Cryptolaemus montrouzieri TaxID=559131 RepID=A0ABD2NAF7_9CUCU